MNHFEKSVYGSLFATTIFWKIEGTQGCWRLDQEKANILDKKMVCRIKNHSDFRDDAVRRGEWSSAAESATENCAKRDLDGKEL